MVLDLQLSLREMMTFSAMQTMLGRDKKQAEGHKAVKLTLKKH